MVANREEAARWFAAQRRGLMTIEECAAYVEWQREPANFAAMAEQHRIWAELEIARDGLSGASQVPAQPPVGRRATFAQVAAIVGVVLLFVGVLDGPGTGTSDRWTTLDWYDR